MKKFGLIVFRWLLLSCVITTAIGVVGEALPKSGPGDMEMGRGLLTIAVWMISMIATLIWAVWAHPGEPISLRNKRDLFLLSAGTLSAAVISTVAAPLLYSSHQLSKRAAETERLVARRERALLIDIQQDWAKGRWQGSLPRCVEIVDKGLKSQCAGSLDLTYCWKMDADKDWGLRGTDCALSEQASIVIRPGLNAMQVPWCRAYSVCVGELHVLDAVAGR